MEPKRHKDSEESGANEWPLAAEYEGGSRIDRVVSSASRANGKGEPFHLEIPEDLRFGLEQQDNLNVDATGIAAGRWGLR
jgi:hypothetical protein